MQHSSYALLTEQERRCLKTVTHAYTTFHTFQTLLIVEKRNLPPSILRVIGTYLLASLR